MPFIKALIPGGVLTWVIALILGSNHSKGGWLDIYRVSPGGIDFYWSWPLFVATTCIAWAIFAMMD
jgi:hypothetical protein